MRQNFEKKENKRQNCEKRNGDKRGLRWRGKKWSKCIFLSSGINVYIFLAGLQRWGNSQKPRWTIVEYCWQSSRKGKCCSRCLDIWTIVSNHDDKTAQGVWTDWPHPPFTRAGLFEPGDELWYRFTVSRFWCLISRSSTKMLSEQCWPHTCWCYQVADLEKAALKRSKRQSQWTLLDPRTGRPVGWVIMIIMVMIRWSV